MRTEAAGVTMRGTVEAGRLLCHYVDLEEQNPARHPFCKTEQVVNDALASLDGELDALYTSGPKLRPC